MFQTHDVTAAQINDETEDSSTSVPLLANPSYYADTYSLISKCFKAFAAYEARTADAADNVSKDPLANPQRLHQQRGIGSAIERLSVLYQDNSSSILFRRIRYRVQLLRLRVSHACSWKLYDYLVNGTRLTLVPKGLTPSRYMTSDTRLRVSRQARRLKSWLGITFQRILGLKLLSTRRCNYVNLSKQGRRKPD